MRPNTLNNGMHLSDRQRERERKGLKKCLRIKAVCDLCDWRGWCGKAVKR